jgi:hypothetical protein
MPLAMGLLATAALHDDEASVLSTAGASNGPMAAQFWSSFPVIVYTTPDTIIQKSSQHCRMNWRTTAQRWRRATLRIALVNWRLAFASRVAGV